MEEGNYRNDEHDDLFLPPAEGDIRLELERLSLAEDAFLVEPEGIDESDVPLSRLAPDAGRQPVSGDNVIDHDALLHAYFLGSHSSLVMFSRSCLVQAVAYVSLRTIINAV
jgi:hypothetical protein